RVPGVQRGDPPELPVGVGGEPDRRDPRRPVLLGGPKDHVRVGVEDLLAMSSCTPTLSSVIPNQAGGTGYHVEILECPRSGGDEDDVVDTDRGELRAAVGEL